MMGDDPPGGDALHEPHAVGDDVVGAQVVGQAPNREVQGAGHEDDPAAGAPRRRDERRAALVDRGDEHVLEELLERVSSRSCDCPR